MRWRSLVKQGHPLKLTSPKRQNDCEGKPTWTHAFSPARDELIPARLAG